MTTAYCVKCKEKRELVSPKTLTSKNGKKYLSEQCKVCGTKMCRFIRQV